MTWRRPSAQRSNRNRRPIATELVRLTLLPATLVAFAGLVAPGCGESRPEHLSSETARAEADEVLAIGDPLARSVGFGALLERAEPDALENLRAALAAAPLDAGDPEYVSFAMWWAGFDPEAALDWASHGDWQADSWPVLTALFRVWAQNEPERAFAQIWKVEERSRNPAIRGAIAGWQDSGKPGLVEAIQAIPDLVIKQRLSETLAHRLVVMRGASGATAWLEEIENPGFRDILAKRVASAAADQGEGAAIAAWATPFVTSGEDRPSGFPRRIGTRWVLRDPEAAWAWLASLPAGEDRDDGVMETFRDWMSLEPIAATLWIEKAEVEPWLEPAFGVYARRIAQQRPKDALDLVAQFKDPKERNRLTVLIAESWSLRDLEAARAWLDQADVTDDVRQRALARATHRARS